jgi:hypothetical protein
MALMIVAVVVLLILLIRKRLAAKRKKSIEDEVYSKASHSQYSIVESASDEDQMRIKKAE